MASSAHTLILAQLLTGTPWLVRRWFSPFGIAIAILGDTFGLIFRSSVRQPGQSLLLACLQLKTVVAPFYGDCRYPIIYSL